jgi:hypothetical protein
MRSRSKEGLMAEPDVVPPVRKTAVERDRFLDALGILLERRATAPLATQEVAEAAGVTLSTTRLFPKRQDPLTHFIARQTQAHEVFVRAARNRMADGARAEAAAHLVAARVPADGDLPMLAAMLAAGQSPERLAPVADHYGRRIERLAADPDGDLLVAATLVADALWFLDAFGIRALSPERRQAVLARMLQDVRRS